MTKTAYYLSVAFLSLSSLLSAQTIELVPNPKSIAIDVHEVGMQVKPTISISVPESPQTMLDHIDAVSDLFETMGKFKLIIEANSDDAAIVVEIDTKMAAEEYRLKIRDGRATISAATIKGFAHATATFLQILGQCENGNMPTIDIHDWPECSYRNVMVDLGRNPHSLSCLKETIDLLWYYKLDSLHLHLTDDQHFAFPSKRFPKLVSENGKISWEEFESLERYAVAKGITLIPELEVPGHSTLLRKHYPEIFGKTTTETAQLETSHVGIKALLDEMIELFPSSPFIHVGGDEAYGVDEDLQRDLINLLHAHVKSKGKKTIVWEGPRLGTGKHKVNKEVIHINWRTINFPADEMLAAGYPVVNAGWDPLYVVDHYPRNNFTMASPQHIYENLDLYTFKHFNPDIKTFHSPIKVKPNSSESQSGGSKKSSSPQNSSNGVIGFCMPWWEGREVNYLPLITPRVIPLAEVAWDTKQIRNYTDFEIRSSKTEAIRQRSFYSVAIAATPMVLETEGVFHNQTTVTLSSNPSGNEVGQIRYTLDGTQPTLDSPSYQSPLKLDKSTILRAVRFANGKQIGHDVRKTFVGVEPIQNLAFGKPVTSSVSSGPIFSTARLTDGGTGTLDYYLGYPTEPEPILVTVDLGSVTAFDQIVVHAFSTENAFESYEIQTSVDGTAYIRVAERREKPAEPSSKMVHDISETEARFVRVLTHGCKGYVYDSFSKLIEIQVFAGSSGK